MKGTATLYSMNMNIPLDILRDLVAIPSVTGDFATNDAGLDYIEKFLNPFPLHITRHEWNGYGALIATTRKTKRPKVMLMAHLDVVPASAELFRLRKQDGRLYGRGTFDMKYAIAAFLAMVADMQDSISNYDFGITIFTDDEGWDTQTALMLEEGYLPDVAVLPDGSQDWQIEKLAKGIMHLRISLPGKSGHGSRPWEGDSASFRVIELLHELQVSFVGHGPHTDTLNIGLVHSGSEAWNQVPDSAEATVDIRVMHKDSLAVLRQRLDVLAKKYGAIIDEILVVPPSLHDLQNEYFLIFADCIKEVTGVKSTGFVSFGGSDASRYVAKGIPCIVVSPPGGGRHGNEEWVDEQGVLDFPRVLRRFIEHVASLKA